MKRSTILSVFTAILIAGTAFGQWNIQIVDNSGDAGTHADIAYDTQGFPHIVYIIEQLSSIDYINYAYWTGSAWNIQELGSDNFNITDCAITIDAGGEIHCCWWEDYPNYLYYENISTGTQTHWNYSTIEFLDISTEKNMHFGDYQVHICFELNSALKHRWYNAGSSQWEEETIDGSADVGDHCSIDTDNDDNIHVCYYDDGGNSLKYGKKEGGVWSTMYVDQTGDAGEYCSIIVDDNGVPHISYYDGANANLKYATLAP